MPNRRRLASLAVIAACALATPAAIALAAQDAGVPSMSASSAIAEAVAAPSRTPANLARDRYRHPTETLGFFGIKPGDTVVELFPGGGWYSEILAPLARISGGTYIAAGPWDRGLSAVRALQASNPAVYGHGRLAEFPATAGSGNPAVADGSADVVLTFRNVHNLRFSGVDRTQAAFAEMFRMLRPGGRLGIVEHRLPEDMPSSMEESSGYMKKSSVIAFAEAAGFRLAAQSDINANPLDTHDYPKGVWTLPPTYREGDVDRARYAAIGESDRMTLLFIKPE